MKKSNYKKSLKRSLIALFLGTSCCWLSALILWIGGASLLTALGHHIGMIQVVLITTGIVLGLYGLFAYYKSKSNGLH